MIDPQLLVTQDAMQCGWDTTNYWLFSENVFSHLIYYSHTYPAGICLFLAAIILPLGIRSVMNWTFFILSVSFAAWSLLDFYLWAATDPGYTMFVWSILSIIEYIMLCSALLLVYYSAKKKYPPFSYFLIAFILSIPVLILTPTPYALEYYDYTNCDREALEGALFHYTYVLQLLAMVILGIFSYMHVKTLQKPVEKRKFILFSSGIIAFLFFFNIGNIVGSFTENWTIAQYGLIGMPILLTFLGYSMTKYQAFNVRVTSSVVFIAFLMALLYAAIFI